MYYTASEGVRETWRDNLQTVTEQFRQHNWLPATVGVVMAGWIALIIMGLQQAIFVNPQVPDRTQVGNSGRNLTVTNASAVVTSTPPASNTSNGGSSSASRPVTVQSQNTGAVATVPEPTATTTPDVIGGRGADGTPDVGAQPPIEVVETPPIDLPPVNVPEAPVVETPPVLPPVDELL